MGGEVEDQLVLSVAVSNRRWSFYLLPVGLPEWQSLGSGCYYRKS